MGHQSAQLLFDRREGSGRTLARLVGTRARAHKTSKEAVVAQRAKVGFCPFCAGPTHVAVPSGYSVGELSAYKARVISLLGEPGTWAARYSAGAF